MKRAQNSNKQITHRTVREDVNPTEREEWTQLPEFPHYMINRQGAVRNVATGHILKPNTTSGVYAVIIRKDGETYHRGVRGLLRSVGWGTDHMHGKE